jgi:phosphoribosylanthranilate isomerase
MDADFLKAGLVILGLFVATGIFAYVMATIRQKKYIVYVDRDIVKTANGNMHQWVNLQKVHYIDKRVMGGGLDTRNFALKFTFNSGESTIDINSNIYGHLFGIAETAKVPKTHTITKGMLRKVS